jgi:hypothetical protein
MSISRADAVFFKVAAEALVRRRLRAILKEQSPEVVE